MNEKGNPSLLSIFGIVGFFFVIYFISTGGNNNVSDTVYLQTQQHANYVGYYYPYGTIDRLYFESEGHDTLEECIRWTNYQMSLYSDMYLPEQYTSCSQDCDREDRYGQGTKFTCASHAF